MSTLKAILIFGMIYVILQLMAAAYFVYMFTETFGKVLELFIGIIK